MPGIEGQARLLSHGEAIVAAWNIYSDSQKVRDLQGNPMPGQTQHEFASYAELVQTKNAFPVETFYASDPDNKKVIYTKGEQVLELGQIKRDGQEYAGEMETTGKILLFPVNNSRMSKNWDSRIEATADVYEELRPFVLSAMDQAFMSVEEPQTTTPGVIVQFCPRI